ncbi:MAG TPA: prolyl oligopeptidase family serine peptidase [Vicinamibacterales bacterium]|nr:prolyl oligopeptidase family serine peptidase [Vicinamibacterales bacterium]
MRTRVLALALIVIALASAATAQTVPFTAEDILKVATASVLDVTEDGRRVAVAVRRLYDNAEADHRRYGDPTYLAPARVRLLVIDTRTAQAKEPFTTLVNVRQSAWSRDGARLALLVAEPPTTASSLPATRLFIWDANAALLRELPVKGDRRVSLNSGLDWTPDGDALIATVRAPDLDRAAAARFHALTDGPIVVHSSSGPFLEWDDLRRADRTREIVEIDARSGLVRGRVPLRKITSYRIPRDGGSTIVAEDVTEKTDYDVIGGTINALRRVARDGAVRTLADGKAIGEAAVRWSDDGAAFAYAKKGEVFVQGPGDEKPRSLTPKPDRSGEDEKKEDPKDARTDEKKEDAESFAVVSFSRDGGRLLLTSKKGWYVADVATGARDRVLPLDEDEEKNPRVSPIDWAPDGKAIYLTYSERGEWQRGLMRLDLATRQLAPLVKDVKYYQAPRLSRDGSTFVFAASEGDRPAELYAADSAFTSVRKLTELNPWIADRKLPRSELVSYRDVDGNVLYGVLRYPVDYVNGQRYPTVFEIYETFFDNAFNARAAFLANHGYAVFHPSVNLVVGRPGEAWVKGVTTAANRLIDMAVADPDRLGVHGTSYGGYATCLLITQTDRFKAAINISGKVNMVSFYTDSPRLGVRNTHAPEKSQDRIGGTLWEYPERYLEHSAILRADRIKTPLLNITGDQDPNVPASQSREMYYALRRLGKPVEWVRYVNGAHRPPNGVAESVDFEGRILAWYDKHLKAEKKKETSQ